MKDRRPKEHSRDMDILPSLAWPFLMKRLACGFRRIRRGAALAIAACWLSSLLSCATPVAIGPDHFGFGIYKVDCGRVNADVSYRHIEGIGAIVIGRRLSVGYVDHRSLCARLEGRDYTTWTPLATLAVGQDAVRAGTEFVFPNNLSLERSE